MTWIDLSGGGEPVLMVDGAVFLRPEDIADPELRHVARQLWDEFARMRHLAEPVADSLARRGRRPGRPVSLRFPDAEAFDRELERE